jgi:hypothetical protein
MLYSNRFRLEPAIIKFDWSFTPNRRFSQAFTTETGSDFIILPTIRSLDFGSNIINLNISFITRSLNLQVRY